MRVTVRNHLQNSQLELQTADKNQDPEVQKKTGKSSPVDVMGALREMKNSM